MGIVIGGFDDCHDGPMLRRLLYPFVQQNAQGHRAPLLWHDVSQPLLRLGLSASTRSALAMLTALPQFNLKRWL